MRHQLNLKRGTSHMSDRHALERDESGTEPSELAGWNALDRVSAREQVQRLVAAADRGDVETLDPTRHVKL